MPIADVIKYAGEPDTFAWKYPNDEIGTWSQLIVNESQEAVLFKDGKAFDVFQAGRYTLETANIPLLNKIINLPFGGRSIFSAEVWFINKTYQLSIKWGTPSPIQIQDPKYGIFVPVRAFGMFGIQIEDAKRFLIKLVGTLPSFGSNEIVQYFRGLYITKTKDCISNYLVQKRISILEINAYIDDLSAYIKTRVEPVMQEYGIGLSSFYVNDISVPENDLAVQNLKNALAKKAEMDIIGYNYQQERSFDTLEGAAKNTGSTAAPMMGMGLGMGMGFGMGQPMGNAFGQIAGQLDITAPAQKQQKLVCPYCGASMDPGAKFCPGCGKPMRKHCTNCGAEVNATAKFCPECGHQLT